MLRVGVIGVGSMGQNHARLYAEMGCLAGVNDAVPDLALKVAKRLNATAYRSIGELLHNVDAVSICTPTTSHFAVAQEALRLGKAVLVEKPFTGDEEQARRLCEIAEENGVTLASGFVERFNPVVKATKDALAAGKFGHLVSISSRRVSSFPTRVRDVGVIKDLAIHDIDVIRYITGLEVRSIYALGGKTNGTEFEDHANLLMEMDGAVIANIEVNWLTQMKVRKVSLTCTSCFAEMDYIGQSLEYSSACLHELDLTDMSSIPLELDVRHVFVRREEPLRRELEAFVRAAETSGKAEVDGWEAVANLKVCDAALMSLACGRQVEISGSDAIAERILTFA